MELQTPRLLLRPWQESDAEALYELAKDPAVGPAAGWNPHKDAEDSRGIIRTVLSDPETYAIVGRRDGLLRGSVGAFASRAASAAKGDLEIGYWVGRPFWGRGIAPEAVEALLARCFTELGAERVWCAYFDGNEKSHRCQEKCGFLPHHTEENVFWAATGETKTEHYTLLMRAQWLARQRTED